MTNDINTALEWNALLEKISSYCQSTIAVRVTKNLEPNLTIAAIKQRWEYVVSLRDLVAAGYTIPIGEIPEVQKVFHDASLGRVLEGEHLRSIAEILLATSKVAQFSFDFSAQYKTLLIYWQRLQTLPKLQNNLMQAIDSKGVVVDSASIALLKIRTQKRRLKHSIESSLRKIIAYDEQVNFYLQDNFITMRAERYVIPMKLDCRGRVHGNIIDTSSSGQTLYFEPKGIEVINTQIQALDLDEKIEVNSILRSLTKQVVANLAVIITNYDNLVELDVLFAQARLAHNLQAHPVKLLDSPRLDLKEAHHPLLALNDIKQSVANDISLSDKNKALVISGPNAGGKTVILKTVGILQLMAKAGLLLPVNANSSMYLYNNLFIDIGDLQSLSDSLSSFSGHIKSLQTVVDTAQKNDLVLLDEIAAGTEPGAGAALAQALLEFLVTKDVSVIVTTHYDSLKLLALHNDVFRNGSMAFSLEGYQPTYKLNLDLPGQSYGLEVAAKMGLKQQIIVRAKKLKGHRLSSLEEEITLLSQERAKYVQKLEALKEHEHQTHLIKLHWQDELTQFKERKRTALKQLVDTHQRQLLQIEEKLTRELHSLKKMAPQWQKDEEKLQSVAMVRTKVKQLVQKERSKLSKIEKSVATKANLPGVKADIMQLKIGQKVYISSLMQWGMVTKKTSTKVEVEINGIKVYVSEGLRV